MEYERYIEQAYKTACKHGFHDKELPNAHYLMLVITEISEAVEADRKNKHANVIMFERESKTKQAPEHVTEHWQFCFEQFIKDTVEDEFADICIRLFDFCGVKHFNIESFQTEMMSEQLLAKFGNRSFTQTAFELCEAVLCISHEVSVEIALAFVVCWAKTLGIDLAWHIEHKMKYNELRANKHGKKY